MGVVVDLYSKARIMGKGQQIIPRLHFFFKVEMNSHTTITLV